MSKEIILVSGLASKGSNLAPMKYIAEYLGGESVSYVDGGHNRESGDIEVSSPEYQTAEISQILQSSPEKNFTIVSHSMGALAALNCLERFDNSKVISIAPPLSNPLSTLRHPHLLSRLKIRQDRLILPSYSFALGDAGPSTTLPEPSETIFPSSIFDEVAEVSENYLGRTIEAIRGNKLSIVMPSQDWNTAGLDAAKQLEQVTYVSAPHSLQTDQVLLERNARIIASVF